MAKQFTGLRAHEKAFTDRFYMLTKSHSAWEVWQDAITMIACSISNVCDKANYERREERYLNIAKKYNKAEMILVSELLGVITSALDEEPAQDFLGCLFMQLELGNNWKGQYFTPFSVCRLMVGICGNMSQQLEAKSFIGISDIACGAGATLIAAVEKAKDEEINFQERILFVGQDIDFTACAMCYIQLSLLGCAGYIVNADTLADPVTNHLNDKGNIWYMPFYYLKVWHWRRAVDGVSRISKPQKVFERKSTQQLSFF